MKEYIFELRITEGNDEFWESLENKSGTEEVQKMIEDALETIGYGQGDDMSVILREYKNKE